MPNTPNPIIFKLTDAGKQAALNAGSETPKIAINLTHVGIGTGKYTPTGSEASLADEFDRIALVTSDVEVVSNTLRFSATITSDTVIPAYEMGFFSDTGALFAVAASASDPLLTVYPDLAFVGVFGITLEGADAANITVSTDVDGSLSLVIMTQHLAAPNPHPQYLQQDHLEVSADPHPQYVALSRFQLLLEILIPIGYLHHTHNASNPKVKFDELLGIDTAWRRLAGKIIVGTDPDDDDIKDVGLTLGQKGMTEAAGAQRPHVYPLHTTNIFERYNPDNVIETVWNVTANKTSIDEGSNIRFTVSANNLPDGQILIWTVKEGDLNAASNDITAPEKATNGTVILNNGSAVVDFLTTPEDNLAESQQHVRLTVAAPADLSMNVPINDAGKTETAVHITQSTMTGIVLDEYYRQQQGDYPLTTDTIRFIVDSGVDIIAPNAGTPSIQEGANWPAGSQIIVENRGRILGRGGDAGLAATFYYNSTGLELSGLVSTQAEQGGTGGTSIKGGMKVDNYGLIAGGGGGGGGGGFFRVSSRGHGSSGGGGGGAPLGRRYPNPKSFEEYTDHFPATQKLAIPPLANPTSGLTYDCYNEFILNGENTGYTSYFRGEIFSGDPLKSDTIYVDNSYHFNADGLSAFNIPDYLDASKTDYRIFSWGTSRGWVGGMRQSTHATVDDQGQGGLNLYTGTGGSVSLLRLSELTGLDISKNKGGDGGSIGEAGEKSLLGDFWAGGKNGDIIPFKASKADLELFVEPKSGGLAGYIKEGSATIINLASGSTKGR